MPTRRTDCEPVLATTFDIIVIYGGTGPLLECEAWSTGCDSPDCSRRRSY